MSILPWTPDQISPLGWYDVSYPGSITELSGAVSQWDDIGGNANHLVQLNELSKPTYLSTGWDGALPAINFEPATDYIESAATVDLPDGVTIIAVFDQDHTTIGSLFGARGPGFFDNKNFAFSVDNTVFNSNGPVTPSVAPTLGKHIRVASKSADATNLKDWVDGTANINHIQTATPDSTGVYITAGNGSFDLTKQFDGRLSEAIIIDGLIDTSTRQKIEGYLAHKWGIETNLAVVHPYRYAAPTRVAANPVLTFIKYKRPDFGFKRLDISLTTDTNLDSNVFVVKDMEDPIDKPNQVPFLLDVASRVDMTEYTTTPDINGIYRASGVTILEHSEHVLDVMVGKISKDVEENINRVQRNPLTALDVNIITSD